MRCKGPLGILIATFLVFAAALGLIIAGTVGAEWWKGKSNSRLTDGISIGLWRTECTHAYKVAFPILCSERADILKYKSKAFHYHGMIADTRDFDVVLTCLIVSCSSGALAFFLSLSMLPCRRSPAWWKAAGVLLTLLGLTSAGTGFAGVIYAEDTFKNPWTKWYDHGWSVILAWIGSGLFFFASVLAFTTMCVAPEPPVGSMIRKTAHGHASSGYDDLNMFYTQPNEYTERYKY